MTLDPALTRPVAAIHQALPARARAGRHLWQCLIATLSVLPALAAGEITPLAAAPRIGLSEVIRQTLAMNPAIRQQQQQVEAVYGGWLQSSARFDPTLRFSLSRKRDNQPLNEYYRRTYNAVYAQRLGSINAMQTESSALGLSLDKTLRNGVTVSGGVSATRSEGTSNDFNRWAPQNLGTVSFSLNIPLLRGSGQSAAAGEQASELEWQASQAELRQTVARQVVAGVNAYWSLLAAGKNLTIAREGEASTRRLLEDTRKLIAADELPAAEVKLIQAALADRQSARISAEQTLLQASHALANVMGLGLEDIARLTADDDFPPLPAQLPPQLPPQFANARPLIEQAQARRADLAAARLRQEAALLLAQAAASDQRPQLDLNVGIGYAGLAEGESQRYYYHALRDNIAGPNAAITLSYQWAVGNSAARGTLGQRAAQHEQATLNHLNLARSIDLSVTSTLAGLLRSVRQLQTAEDAVATYRISLDNEKIKNRLGSSTMLNVLSVADSLRNARLAHVNYYQNYLNALAALCYETGALIGDDPATQTIDLAKLVRPDWLAGRPD